MSRTIRTTCPVRCETCDGEGVVTMIGDPEGREVECPDCGGEGRCGREVMISRGDPGCRYTRNGDGWPPEPPEIECEVHGFLEGDDYEAALDAARDAD